MFVGRAEKIGLRKRRREICGASKEKYCRKIENSGKEQQAEDEDRRRVGS